jgi:diphosphomevalonate decarboxylase
MKATSIAHPSVALIKYWGKDNEELKTPMNSNISITIDSLYCKTTVEFSEQYEEDNATINGEQPPEKVMKRAIEHIDRVRKMAGIDLKAKGAVEMNFQLGVGLASSAAGFSSLSLAASKAAGLDLDEKQLSILARNGSGSSCRSVYGGYVEWSKGSDQDSYAKQLADENHFDIRIITAVVSTKERMIDTRGGMKIAKDTSPLYNARLEVIEKQLPELRKAIQEKDFTTIGKITELNCMLLHATAITADPILLYWTPETLKIMHNVRVWREEGLEVYYTADTGANVHVLCLPKDEEEVAKRLQNIEGVMEIHKSKPGKGAKLVDDHLF